MNELLKRIPVWQLVIAYLVANVLNVGCVMLLRQIVPLSQAVADELMRGLMFLFVILWFVFLIVKNKVAITPEIKGLRSGIRTKEFLAILVFNYTISLTIVFGLLCAATIFLGQSAESTMEAAGAAQNGNIQSIIVGFIGAGLLAPVAEELIFRGVLLNRLKSRVPVTAAIIISSVLFGVTHLSLSSLGATIFGVCMCVLYLKTNNIFVPMAMHLVHNLILCLVEIMPSSTLGSMDLTFTVAIIGFGICAMIAICAGVFLTREFHFFSLKGYRLNEEAGKEINHEQDF